MAQAAPNPYVDCLSPSTGVCWSQAANIRLERERDVEFYRQLAARHRAAVAALKGAEGAACADIADDDRDISPFFHRPDILSVKPLRADAEGGISPILGALIVFRPVPGLTEERLQRSVDCHLARAAALGHDTPELRFCPLMPKGVEARVSSTASGFAVAVTANERGSAEEVWRRAASLMERPSNDY